MDDIPHSNYIGIELMDDGSLSIGPLDWLADADPYLASEFLSEAIDAMNAVRESLGDIGGALQ